MLGAAKRLLAMPALLVAALLLIVGPVGSTSVCASPRASAEWVGYAYDGDPQLFVRTYLLVVTPRAEIAAEGSRVTATTEPTPATATGVAPEPAAARGGVYTLRDKAGAVVRTGRTKALAARQAAHFNDPVLGRFKFNEEYRTDVYAEQRGLEQMLYDRYPGAQAANGGFNKIRGISLSNPNLSAYMQSGLDLLQRLGLG